MIDGIPGWLFYLGMGSMFAAWAGLSIIAPLVDTLAPSFAIDILRVPAIGRFVRSRPARFAAQGAVALLFVLVILAGLFGRQQSGANIATILTWTYWWTLLVVFVVFFGKAWCYICPWDGLATWLERLALWRVTRGGLSARLSWPRSLRNLYPATVLFLVLTWLELGYGVTTRPELTALLGILMFFLTFVPVLLFDRHGFCRYGCLVGRISGLYSLFAALEVRPRDASVCRDTCSTHDCYHGNDRGYGCPTFQYLGAMTKNTYCIYCAECVQTCPHENVAINLRPFGADLTKQAMVRFDEAAMVIVMLAMTTFHGLTMTPAWGTVVTVIGRTLGVPYLAAFTVGMFAFLALVAVLYVAVATVAHLAAPVPGTTRRQLAVRYAYAFLPVALFYHLAHNSMHFFIEGGALWPVLSDPLGWHWDLFGTAGAHPGALLPPGLVWGLMVVLLLVGLLWSLLAARRISLQLHPAGRLAFASRIPILAAMLAYSLLSLWIVAQPMQMRTGL